MHGVKKKRRRYLRFLLHLYVSEALGDSSLLLVSDSVLLTDQSVTIAFCVSRDKLLICKAIIVI